VKQPPEPPANSHDARPKTDFQCVTSERYSESLINAHNNC
jgi:hypothetical protein